MSRSPLATPNKQAVKKAQGALKTLVSTYGTLVLSWASDVQEVLQLLMHLNTLVGKQAAIENCANELSSFSSIVEKSDLVSCKLTAMITAELESTVLQIRTFEKRMKDTLCAMTVTCEDTMKVVQNESADLIEDGAIFTAEHVLDMQLLQKAYMLELDRKSALLKVLYGSQESSADRRDAWQQDMRSRVWTAEQLDGVIRNYADTEDASLIPLDAVELFLQRNNIRGV